MALAQEDVKKRWKVYEEMSANGNGHGKTTQRETVGQ
jgi:hypothetical protein